MVVVELRLDVGEHADSQFLVFTQGKYLSSEKNSFKTYVKNISL